MNAEIESDLVFLPVQPQDTGNGNLRCSLSRDGAAHTCRHEYDFRKFRALQNFLMHPLVAPIAAAITARGVNDNRSARLARCGIEVNYATLQFKCSMNGVKRRVKSKFHGGFGGIEVNDRFLSECRRCERACRNEGERENCLQISSTPSAKRDPLDS